MPNFESDAKLSPVKEKNKKTVLIRAVITVAIILCIMGAGVLLSTNLKSKEIVMKDLTGCTQEEAEEYIANLNKENDWDIDLYWGNTVFDLNAESGTVASQSVEPGVMLFDPTEDSSQKDGFISMIQISDDLCRDAGGPVYGSITCTTYTNQCIRYEELRDLNAFELAKKLNVDTNSSSFVRENKENTSYYDVLRVVVEDNVIPAEFFSLDGEAAYFGGNITIVYSKEPFFYWESLPDFKTDYQNYQNVHYVEFPVYVWKKETDKEPTKVGEQSLITQFVEDVTILDKDGNEVEIFRDTDPVTVFLHMTKQRPTPTPTPPMPRESGTRCLKPDLL